MKSVVVLLMTCVVAIQLLASVNGELCTNTANQQTYPAPTVSSSTILNGNYNLIYTVNTQYATKITFADSDGGGVDTMCNFVSVNSGAIDGHYAWTPSITPADWSSTKYTLEYDAAGCTGKINFDITTADLLDKCGFKQDDRELAADKLHFVNTITIQTQRAVENITAGGRTVDELQNNTFSFIVDIVVPTKVNASSNVVGVFGNVIAIFIVDTVTTNVSRDTSPTVPTFPWTYVTTFRVTTSVQYPYVLVSRNAASNQAPANFESDGGINVWGGLSTSSSGCANQANLQDGAACEQTFTYQVNHPTDRVAAGCNANNQLDSLFLPAFDMTYDVRCISEFIARPTASCVPDVLSEIPLTRIALSGISNWCPRLDDIPFAPPTLTIYRKAPASGIDALALDTDFAAFTAAGPVPASFVSTSFFSYQSFAFLEAQFSLQNNAAFLDTIGVYQAETYRTDLTGEAATNSYRVLYRDCGTTECTEPNNCACTNAADYNSNNDLPDSSAESGPFWIRVANTWGGESNKQFYRDRIRLALQWNTFTADFTPVASNADLAVSLAIKVYCYARILAQQALAPEHPILHTMDLETRAQSVMLPPVTGMGLMNTPIGQNGAGPAEVVATAAVGLPPVVQQPGAASSSAFTSSPAFIAGAAGVGAAILIAGAVMGVVMVRRRNAAKASTEGIPMTSTSSGTDLNTV